MGGLLGAGARWHDRRSAVCDRRGARSEDQPRGGGSYLLFTAAAAVTGFLGLVVSWLSFRLESGRVPRPDLAVVSDGKLVRRWELEIELLDPEPDVSAETQKERRRLEAVIEKYEHPARPAPTSLAAVVLGSAFTASEVSDEAIADYRKDAEEYLGRYEEYLRKRHLVETFWARSRELIFAFTNERAGVPAEGVRAVLFPQRGAPTCTAARATAQTVAGVAGTGEDAPVEVPLTRTRRWRRLPATGRSPRRSRGC